MRKLNDKTPINFDQAPLADENLFDFAPVIEDLEKKSWCLLPHEISPQICHDLYNFYQGKSELFKEAHIGNFSRKTKNEAIRKSQITWIEDWHHMPATIFLNEFYQGLATKIRRSFMVPLKWHEGQVGLYNHGDYYKKHLDQLKFTKHRQVTTVLFLNDCPEGGELVIYNKNDKNIIDQVITPRAGSLVIFFSAHIFHEVLPTIGKRMTLTTWMRDDSVPFLD